MRLHLICFVLVLTSCGRPPDGKQALLAIDVPASVKLGYVSGMVARIESDHTFKVLIYGETEAHGGVRLTPVVFGRVAPDGETKISEQTVVTVEQPTPIALRCYRGVLLCDSARLKVQINLEVKEAGAWHPFGWNGDWPLIVADIDSKE